MRVLPKELSDNRGEMTAAQMIDAVAQLDRQLQIAAQPLVRRGHRDRAGARSARIRSAAASVGG